MSIMSYRDIFPQIHESVFVAPGAWVIGDVVIGERSSIWFNTVVRGDVHHIRIGADTSVQDNSTLHVTKPDFPLLIGSRVVIGHKAIVHGCVVEDDCMIGMGAIILDGAKIGAGSVIAAGALVTPGMVVPPESVVMGNPAHVKRTTGDKEKELIRRSWSHYADMAAEYRGAGAVRLTKIKGFLG